MLTTVPMWFGLSDADHADQTITRLAGKTTRPTGACASFPTAPNTYDGSGYHYGSVWPLFTGWASVAEYRYHRSFPPTPICAPTPCSALDGSLGHFTEVLSGDYYQSFATSSPHQIWSAAMVISPILRGCLDCKRTSKSVRCRLRAPCSGRLDFVRGSQRASRERRPPISAFRKPADSLLSKSNAPAREIAGIAFSPP